MNEQVKAEILAKAEQRKSWGRHNILSTLSIEYGIKLSEIDEIIPVQKIENREMQNCHYCGQSTTKLDLFGSPCCKECGG